MSQAIVVQAPIPTTIPSMIPASAVKIEPIFIPVLRFGHEDYVPEINMARTRRGEVVADILSGEFRHDVIQILAVDLAGRESWDATQEIADDVFNSLIREGEGVPEHLVSFLEDWISMNELAPFLKRRLAA